MPLQLPHPNTPLHLYRHILREATYLPPLARPWMFQHIKSRFRKFQKVEESKQYIKDAHRKLRYLRAANAGHVERMVRICFLATGRLGKRRRELANAYLKKPPPEDSAASGNDVNSSSKPMARQSAAAWGIMTNGTGQTNVRNVPPTLRSSWLEKWDLGKVKLLGESQFSQQANTSDWVKENKVRRTIDPRQVVITENCWGLTLKPKQMTRRLQKHWVSVLSSVMPPLPRKEWDHLANLTAGKAAEEFWKIPRRRPVAVSAEKNRTAVKDEDGAVLWDWEKHATIPIRMLERKNSRRMKVLSGSSDENLHHDDRPIGVRAFKPRSLKRSIYGRVWQASPLLSMNHKGRWSVTWGNTNKEAMPSVATFSDMQFFQGVDEKGKVPIQQASKLKSR